MERHIPQYPISGLKSARKGWKEEHARNGKDDRKPSYVCKNCGHVRFTKCACCKKNEKKDGVEE